MLAFETGIHDTIGIDLVNFFFFFFYDFWIDWVSSFECCSLF